MEAKTLYCMPSVKAAKHPQRALSRSAGQPHSCFNSPPTRYPFGVTINPRLSFGLSRRRRDGRPAQEEFSVWHSTGGTTAQDDARLCGLQSTRQAVQFSRPLQALQSDTSHAASRRLHPCSDAGDANLRPVSWARIIYPLSSSPYVSDSARTFESDPCRDPLWPDSLGRQINLSGSSIQQSNSAWPGAIQASTGAVDPKWRELERSNVRRKRPERPPPANTPTGGPSLASHLRKSHVEEQSLDGSSKMKGHGCDSAARGATDGLSVGAELHGANRRVLNARAHSLPDSREPFLVNHDPWFLTHHTGAVLGDSARFDQASHRLANDLALRRYPQGGPSAAQGLSEL
ncbi:hypothetical protein VTN96DRAFT_8948 [Rasamsonia emersonii]